MPEPEALLNASIFFDFRPLYGREELVADLQHWLLRKVKGNAAFFRAMTANALGQEPPLSWWRDFRLGGGKEFPHTLDLKGQGIRVFVDAVRILALAHGVANFRRLENFPMPVYRLGSFRDHHQRIHSTLGVTRANLGRDLVDIKGNFRNQDGVSAA